MNRRGMKARQESAGGLIVRLNLSTPLQMSKGTQNVQRTKKQSPP
jgi:hypothetical protein